LYKKTAAASNSAAGENATATAAQRVSILLARSPPSACSISLLNRAKTLSAAGLLA
jgi:hypothetical protein